jgi:hypothetical protein
MKTSNSILFILVLCTVFLGSSCKKDKLTKETQTGANTFSCKVDGKIFKSPENGELFGGKPVFVSNLPTDGFTILGKGPRDDYGIKAFILIKLPYLKATGTYQLNNYFNGQYKINYAGGPLYKTNDSHTGAVNITRCDTVNKIYSGTFSFNAIDDNTGKVVNITDGRFDVKQ